MKIYYEALSKIPKRFIDDETKCCTMGYDRVFLTNPKYAPLMYIKGRWQFIKHTSVEIGFDSFIVNGKFHRILP